jgi:cytochrome c biogenesis protein CcmG, thiol:disulfide interchange protein DsbE
MKRRRQTSAGLADDRSEVGPPPKPGPRRRRWLIGGCVAVFVTALGVAGALASGSASRSAVRTEAPRVAPAFRLPQLSKPDHVLSLEEFRGRPVVMNFWASWCVPCRTEMPVLQAVATKVRGRVAFVGIDHQDTRDDALAFVHKTGVRYPIAFDPDGTTARAYGLVGVPTTVFIDARGREVARHLGKLDRDDLTRFLEQLFPAATGRS